MDEALMSIFSAPPTFPKLKLFGFRPLTVSLFRVASFKPPHSDQEARPFSGSFINAPLIYTLLFWLS